MNTIPGVRRWLAAAGLLAALLLTATECSAIVISAAAPTTTVPAFVPASLGPGQFLVPIVATGAAGLQDWSFDLHFDPLVVQQVDLGGFYYGVFAAPFDALQTDLSSITGSGFLLDGVLAGVSGFSGGVSGDGLLAYVAFAYLPGQGGEDPGVSVGGVTVTQPVPEPGSIALASLALLLLGHRQRQARRVPSAEAKDTR